MNRFLLVVMGAVAFCACGEEPHAFTNMVASVFCKAPAGVLFPDELPEVYLRRGVDHRQLVWRLKDWTGRVCGGGKWPDSCKLELCPLPTGYYWLSVSNVTSGACLRETALCVMERMPQLSDDSRYAIMTALPCVARNGQTDCPWFGGDVMRRDAHLLGLLGFSCVREIEIWPEIEPQRGLWKGWSERFEKGFRYLSDENVRRLSFFESAPSWTKEGERGADLPRDLVSLYRFCERLAVEGRGQSAGWEFWNEQDIEARCHEGAWEYAACLKAASLGFKAGDPKKPVVNGAFCQNPTYPYVNAVCANDIAPYIDAFNYHTYGNLTEYESWMANVRKLTAKMGVPEMAIWITEHHTNQEGDSTEDSVRPKFKQHSRVQELVVTEFTPKALVKMAQLGAARDFYFILSSLNERNGTKDWGLCRRDGTVKPAYCALGTYLRQVGRAKLEGECDFGPGVKAFLFSLADGSQTLLAWAISNLDTGGEVRELHSVVRYIDLPDASEHEVFDTCGMRRMAKGAVELSRYPVYISGLTGLQVSVPAVRAGKLGAKPLAADEDPTVVVQLRVNRDDFSFGGQRASVEMIKDRGRARLEVWNLSNENKCGSLTFEQGTFDGVPAVIEIPAWRSAAFETTFVPERDEGRLVVSGRFGDKRITRLVMDYRNLARALADAEVVHLDVANPVRWKKNTNASSWAACPDADGQAISFEAKWNNGVARWTYPIFAFGHPLPDEVFQVEYEVRMEQDKQENDVDFCHVQVGYGDGRPLLYLSQIPPSKSWERRVAIIPPASPGDSSPGCGIDRLQFGCGPRGTTLRYDLRNVRLACRRKPTADVTNETFWIRLARWFEFQSTQKSPSKKKEE